MSLALAVALLALLVALFTLVALVAVYARLRQVEAGRAGELSGYASVIGRPAPAAVRPRDAEPAAVVAVLDADCALCRRLWSELCGIADENPGPPVRLIAVIGRYADADDFPPHRKVELLADVSVRADLFEGYSPTVLVTDDAGTITSRSFVYPDTDVRALVAELVPHDAPLGGRQ